MKHPTALAMVVILITTAGSGALCAQEEWGSNTARPGGDLPGRIAIELVRVADGFIDPVNVTAPPDGSGRLFVVERPGTVRIVKGGRVLDRPFLDIRPDVLSAFLEQGLYDLEFHPDFRENGLFYVHYADLMRNGDSMIVRYRVSDDDPDRADLTTAKPIMKIAQPWANHNGGELAFGPDGYLYIGSGDGGWEGDPLEAGQDLSTLLGKILRIDVNVTGKLQYAIPEDNPFYQPLQVIQLFGVTEEQFARIHTEARPEIWAYGLRNPWKFSFDRKTGDLYIADVGQNHWEEVHFQPGDSGGGENYGWDWVMGTKVHPIQKGSGPRIGVPPIAEYSHTTDGICVVGFGVYRGESFPEMEGVYFLGDWGSGKVFGLARDADGRWALEELLDTKLQFTGAGEDEAGEIHITSAGANYGGPVDPADNPPGALWRMVAAEGAPADAETAPLDAEE